MKLENFRSSICKVQRFNRSSIYPCTALTALVCASKLEFNVRSMFFNGSKAFSFLLILAISCSTAILIQENYESMPGSKSVDAVRKTAYRPRNLACVVNGCLRHFSTPAGRTNHMNTAHPLYQPTASGSVTQPARSPTPIPLGQDDNGVNDPFDDDIGEYPRRSPTVEPELKSKRYTYEYHPKLNGNESLLFYEYYNL